MITNIKGSDIITLLLDILLERINDDSIRTKIIQIASDAEYNLIHGRRDIMHLDFFILGVIKELIDNNYSEKKVIKKKIVKKSGSKKTNRKWFMINLIN